MSIYVEITIQGRAEDVWRLTQTPELHERWDLRFTSITYLPSEEGQAQRFIYETRIGFGLQIKGEGETIGEQSDAEGRRTSSLRFWTSDVKSLILEGSGYWKYEPVEAGVTFTTGYDYRVRYGRIGKLIDRLIFRPVMGWATAWSFDRLRMWIEQETSPAVSARIGLTHWIARVSVACVWIYHGLIPKVLLADATEAQLLLACNVPAEHVRPAMISIGIAEVILGVLILVVWRSHWPLWLTIALMIVALAGVGVTAPWALGSAFNAVTLNLLTAAAALIAIVLSDLAPSAGRCRRKAEAEH